MCKDLLIRRAKIAQLFMMNILHMLMKAWPTPASNVTVCSRTVVAKEQNCVIMNLLLLVDDAQDVISLLEVGIGKVLIALIGIVCEDNIFCFCLQIFS